MTSVSDFSTFFVGLELIYVSCSVLQILYGVPIAKNKIQPLQQLRNEIAPYNGIVRLLLDHPQQVRFLEEAQRDGASKRWSVFVKVNGGQKFVNGLFILGTRTDNTAVEQGLVQLQGS